MRSISINKKTSRTHNVSRNLIVGMICQGITLIINFVLRTYYIKALGADYLGVNGLFSNILSILSFAELGIGNALVFSMYKPLSVNDTEKLGSLMDLYKTVYRSIALIVAVCGLCVIPFLKFIIHDTPDIPESITLLYVLVLTNTVVSYLLTYKKSIIIADQKNYIVLVINEVVKVTQKVVQIVLLLLFHSYILYLVTEIVGTIIVNIISYIVAHRMYPFLNEKAKKISQEEKKGIFENVYALAAYKFGNVILDGTDSILVSILDSVAAVGVLSNYILINTSLTAILNKVKDAFTASVGNLNAQDDISKKERIFNEILFITAWIYGFASIGLLIVSPVLIDAWIGTSYVLDNATLVAIIIGFYVDNMGYASLTYRNTLGYFKKGRTAPIIAAVANIVLSVVLFKLIGLPGIFIATPISRFFTLGIVDPYLVYKNCFKKSVVHYYLQYFKYALINLILYFVCRIACNYIYFDGWISVVIHVVVVTIFYNCIMLIFFHKNQFCIDIIKRVLSLIKRR